MHFDRRTDYGLGNLVDLHFMSLPQRLRASVVSSSDGGRTLNAERERRLTSSFKRIRNLWQTKRRETLVVSRRQAMVVSALVLYARRRA
jgi:hypothetical protein